VRGEAVRSDEGARGVCPVQAEGLPVCPRCRRRGARPVPSPVPARISVAGRTREPGRATGRGGMGVLRVDVRVSAGYKRLSVEASKALMRFGATEHVGAIFDVLNRSGDEELRMALLKAFALYPDLRLAYGFIRDVMLVTENVPSTFAAVPVMEFRDHHGRESAEQTIEFLFSQAHAELASNEQIAATLLMCLGLGASDEFKETVRLREGLRLRLRSIAGSTGKYPQGFTIAAATAWLYTELDPREVIRELDRLRGRPASGALLCNIGVPLRGPAEKALREEYRREAGARLGAALGEREDLWILECAIEGSLSIESIEQAPKLSAISVESELPLRIRKLAAESLKGIGLKLAGRNR
jgi:hypothetical protein